MLLESGRPLSPAEIHVAVAEAMNDRVAKSTIKNELRRRLRPDLDVERVRDFCQSKASDHALDQLRVEMDIGRGYLTIVECRAPWREDFGAEWTRMPVARLRYVQRTGIWTLYYRDRNSRFHLYDLIGPSAKIDVLLKEIERDPTGNFWG